jgi:hypothetical protein
VCRPVLSHAATCPTAGIPPHPQVASCLLLMPTYRRRAHQPACRAQLGCRCAPLLSPARAPPGFALLGCGVSGRRVSDTTLLCAALFRLMLPHAPRLAFHHIPTSRVLPAVNAKLLQGSAPTCVPATAPLQSRTSTSTCACRTCCATWAPTSALLPVRLSCTCWPAAAAAGQGREVAARTVGWRH